MRTRTDDLKYEAGSEKIQVSIYSQEMLQWENSACLCERYIAESFSTKIMGQGLSSFFATLLHT